MIPFLRQFRSFKFEATGCKTGFGGFHLNSGGLDLTLFQLKTGYIFAVVGRDYLIDLFTVDRYFDICLINRFFMAVKDNARDVDGVPTRDSSLWGATLGSMTAKGRGRHKC